MPKTMLIVAFSIHIRPKTPSPLQSTVRLTQLMERQQLDY